MFSPEFMRFLINYQKSDFAPEKTKKEIPLKINKRGKLAWVDILVTKYPARLVRYIYAQFFSHLINNL